MKGRVLTIADGGSGRGSAPGRLRPGRTRPSLEAVSGGGGSSSAGVAPSTRPRAARRPTAARAARRDGGSQRGGVRSRARPPRGRPSTQAERRHPRPARAPDRHRRTSRTTTLPGLGLLVLPAATTRLLLRLLAVLEQRPLLRCGRRLLGRRLLRRRVRPALRLQLRPHQRRRRRARARRPRRHEGLRRRLLRGRRRRLRRALPAPEPAPVATRSLLKIDGYRTHRYQLYVSEDNTHQAPPRHGAWLGPDTMEDLAGEIAASTRSAASRGRPDADATCRSARTTATGRWTGTATPATRRRPRRADPTGERAPGLLRLVVTPDDASVYVDGRFFGSARQTGEIELTPGPPPGRGRAAPAIAPSSATWTSKCGVRGP